MADLDHPMFRHDPHEAGKAAGGMRLAVDEGERQGIVHGGALLEPGHEVSLARERSVGQVIPRRVGPRRRRVQLLAVARYLERLEQHAISRERYAVWSFDRPPSQVIHRGSLFSPQWTTPHPPSSSWDCCFSSPRSRVKLPAPSAYPR